MASKTYSQYREFFIEFGNGKLVSLLASRVNNTPQVKRPERMEYEIQLMVHEIGSEERTNTMPVYSRKALTDYQIGNLNEHEDKGWHTTSDERLLKACKVRYKYMAAAKLKGTTMTEDDTCPFATSVTEEYFLELKRRGLSI